MDDFSMWVIYDHPSDYPTAFVARRYEGGINPGLTEDVMLATDIDVLRQGLILAKAYLVRINPHPLNDPTIIETWVLKTNK